MKTTLDWHEYPELPTETGWYVWIDNPALHSNQILFLGPGDGYAINRGTWARIQFPWEVQP